MFMQLFIVAIVAIAAYLIVNALPFPANATWLKYILNIVIVACFAIYAIKFIVAFAGVSLP